MLPMRWHRLIPIIAALLLAACDRADSDPAAGGLTVGETETLEAAAERLDARAESPGKTDSHQLEGEVRARLDAKLREKTSN